jgi:hypothetical protein
MPFTLARRTGRLTDPVLLLLLAVPGLFLALACWVSGAWFVRLLLAGLSGGLLVAGFAGYARSRWVRGGPASARRRPMGLLILGWLLSLGGALSGSSRPDERPPEPPTPPSTQPTASRLFAAGPRRFLSDMEEFDVKSGELVFSKNGKIVVGVDSTRSGTRVREAGILVGGVLSPKGIGMPPPSNGTASAKYRLDREAAVFKAKAALNDGAEGFFGPAFFEVLGDGLTLWKSGPVQKRGDVKECTVDVTDVRILELRVTSPQFNHGLHAVWLDPRILRRADTPDE